MNIDSFLTEYLANYNNLKSLELDGIIQVVCSDYYTAKLTALYLSDKELIEIPQEYLPYRTDKLMVTLGSNNVNNYSYLVYIPHKKYLRLFSSLQTNVFVFSPDILFDELLKIYILGLNEEYTLEVVKKFSKRCVWKYEKEIGKKVYNVSKGNYNILKILLLGMSKLNSKRELNDNFFTNLLNKKVDSMLADYVLTLLDENTDFNSFILKTHEVVEKMPYSVVKKLVCEKISSELINNLDSVEKDEVYTLFKLLSSISKSDTSEELTYNLISLFEHLRNN